MSVQAVVIIDSELFGIPCELSEPDGPLAPSDITTKPYVHLRSDYHDGAVFSYDGDGNVSQVTATYGNQVMVTTLTYDDGVIATVTQELDGTLIRTETFQYVDGNLTQSTIS